MLLDWLPKEEKTNKSYYLYKQNRNTMKELSEQQLLLLRKPLPPAAIKKHPTKAYLSTIKAIYVTERLNDVFGVGRWTIKTSLLPFDGDNIVRVTLRKNGNEEFATIAKTILEVPEYGIYYECIAGSSNDDMGDAAKGGTTDGITKICSYLGIGAEVYKGEYSEEEAIKAHIASIDTLTALEVFWDDNKGSVNNPNTLKTFVAKRKAELTPQTK
jgi:hypothetical protein